MENAEMKNYKKRRSGRRKLTIGVLILMICIGIIAYRYYEKSLEPISINNPEEVNINIPPFTSINGIANILEENKLIRNKFIFKYKVRSSNVADKLKAGKYNLSTDMNLNEIINSLVKGGISENTLKFTIPEGYELRQIAEKLSTEGIVDKEKFLKLVMDKSNFEDKYEFLKELEDGQSLEGFLFPSTYEIFKSSTEEEIIDKMLSEFEKIYKNEIEPNLNKFDLTLNEIITLASIIEREGKVDEERPLMSAVFHNRLKDGMRLQSCATVQYVLGERKAHLTEKDTQIKSPYNTYVNEGLPPAPIAAPGKTSLVAAVNPADVDYMFFVLTGEDGTHTFTRTYEEHKKAIPKN